VQVVDAGVVHERPDRLVTEEPMEIRAHGPGQSAAPVTVTMRTPGNDFELAVGFCVSERVVARAHDIAAAAYCLSGGAPQEYNVVTVSTRTPIDLEAHRRAFVSNASCGLCGKTTLDQVEAACDPITSDVRVGASVLVALPDRLRTEQAVFDATGGVHAAALFAADGKLECLREDIGRHNALDKVIGRALIDGIVPLGERILCVSGRLSFELVQKAAVAGGPILVGVSAPSSLAISLAQERGMTLCGFARGDRVNVYTHAERVV
jgi:FdhD protein